MLKFGHFSELRTFYIQIRRFRIKFPNLSDFQSQTLQFPHISMPLHFPVVISDSMASSSSSPYYGVEALSSPRLMLAKGVFGVVRSKRKLQRETPPRIPHPVSEASFESHHLPKLPNPKGKKGAREPGERMILRHLQLDSSVFANSSSQSDSISSKSEEEDKVQELIHAPPKDFLEELIQKYSSQGQMNFAEVVKAKAHKPVKVFWEKKHGLGYIPSAREGATLTPVNRRLYLFGGESRSLFNDIKILNPETWKWESAALSAASDPVPEPRSGHSTVNYKNSLVVFGGGGAFNPMLKIRKCFNRVHVFDTSKGICSFEYVDYSCAFWECADG